MKKLDYKVILVAIFLLIIAFFSYSSWELVSQFLMRCLSSKVITFSIWALLVVTAIIHYNKNHNNNENEICDKEGLDKPIEYIFFILRYGAIGSTIQALSKESFAFCYFKELSKCSGFDSFDTVSFVLVILVLIIYSYGKIKPIFQETYIKKSKIRLEESEE